jgi:RXT2-like, N-terminal
MVEYGGKLRTIIDHNPKRRRKYIQEEEEDEEDEEEEGERDPFDDDTWPYSQVNLKGRYILC